MILLQIENLTKSVGTRMLFADVTFGINEGDKIGLVAKNGTGKTTLLRCIAGTETPDSGRLTFRNGVRVSILEQTPVLDPDATILEACLDPQNPVAQAAKRYEEALESANPDALDAAQRLMDSTGAWDYEDKLRQILSQLQIDHLDQPVSQLSGGQRKRVALAKLILEQPDLVILDEPTNHLDISTIEWLEAWLAHSRVTLLMVTHDRYFLDRVCNKIIEIDREQLYAYDGNFDYYLRRRRERIEAMTAELAKVKNTLRREQEWMRSTPPARTGKAKYRIDAFHDLKQRSQVRLAERNVELDVKSSYIGSKIFIAHHISKSFGEKKILDDFNYVFARRERLGIVGPNGVGKTTFIKLLQGLIAPDSGEWEIGETVRFGYYSQEGIRFDENKRVIDAVTEIADDIALADGRSFSPMQFLQHFLFPPADQQKYIHTLSGGERARLHLATVLMRSPNFLILDEPTNDLDIITLGILEDYLREFDGCLIVISHDRFFLDSVVDHLFVFTGDGAIKDFPGTYSEYRVWADEQKAQLASAAPKAAPKSQQQPRSENRPRRMTYRERQEFEQLSASLDALNAEYAAIEATFSSGETVADIQALSARYAQLRSLIDEAELRWLELSELE